ncbi:hypothetical protein [Hydrocoleum sp. CS-953]|uniref:hypothetical protein n=1 Tax=Microcoleaceae TaxID=1892252 RepID=UPI00117BD906|nr:hypothetical protein [Hydrocoleum sp. CS-953]
MCWSIFQAFSASASYHGRLRTSKIESRAEMLNGFYRMSNCRSLNCFISAIGKTHPTQEFNFDLIKSLSITFWSIPGKD